MLNSQTLVAKVDHAITKAIKDACKAGDREAAVSWSGVQIEFMQDPEAFVRRDPVMANQSKHADANGELRYDADGSLVFPSANGVRTPVTAASDGASWMFGQHASS